jgi:hypothetical protein
MKTALRTRLFLNSLTFTALGLLTTLSGWLPKAEALTITRNFVEPTEEFPGFSGLNGGSAPSNAAGGGNLVDIFNTAADVWEAFILDDFTLTLNFGWAPLTRAKASHRLVNEGGTPHRETEGTIRFDNDESFSWFLDSTPHRSEEYQNLVGSTEDLGGGVINVERRYSSSVSGSDAVGRFDLLQTAMHEIGHALGMSNANNAYIAEKTDNEIDVTSPRPFDGSKIPVTGSHFTTDLNEALMMGTGLPRTQRRYPSAVDILANAQVSQFAEFNLEPVAEGTASATFSNPEPTCPPATCTGIGTNSITWGIPGVDAPLGLPNSVSITDNSFTAQLGTPFVAGTIQYFNGSVQVGSEISEVDLLLNTMIDIPTLGIEDFALSTLRPVSIINTLNTDDPTASADFLSISPPSGASNSFGNNFHVLEGSMATAELYGIINLSQVEDVDFVPSDASAINRTPPEAGDEDPVPLDSPTVNQSPSQEFVFEILGFGQVISGEGFVTSTKVPEPSSLLSLLAFGTLGASSALLRNKKQHKLTKKQKAN